MARRTCAVALTAALALTACDGGPPAQDRLTPVAAVQGVAAATAEAGTSKIALTSSSSIQGQPRQDGADTIHGRAGDDDVFGELGRDTLFGDADEDVLLGDRGGVRNETASVDGPTITSNQVPKETYTAWRTGDYVRRVDLQNDTDGQTWLGAGKAVTIPLGSLLAGDRDTIRGGSGDDQVHAGLGDDLANGDSGGDELFGDDGSDALWGGRGCVAAADSEDVCPVAGDPSQRGDDDRFVDHLMGGRGGDPKNAVFGADILDWAPRTNGCTSADFPTEAGKTTAQDPCAWQLMTDQGVSSHQGTDWIYGGWDRDVMQGDVAQNGPNPGDRLIDWDGAYNLYSHCNAAYGGFNDIRQHSPDMQSFLQLLAFGMGAGQQRADASTSGTAAYRELQLVYPGETAHSAGKAYPTTPGHFDEPVTCVP